MPATATEGGIRSKRYEYVQESTVGTPPSNPSWSLPSDNVTNFEWSPSAGVELRRGTGTADVVEVHNGPEEHEVTVEYDMQQFPTDGSGNPNSLDGDGILRDGPQNALPNTHTFVAREEKDGLTSGQTVNGSTSKDTRTYVVMVGGYISEVEYSGDPGSDQPVTVTVTYQAEKVREYQLDQPGSSQTLDITSTSTNDTSQDVTIENEDAGTTETITLSGTSTVTTTTSFSDIDAIRLSAETEGDVQISGTSSGDQLAVIRGQNFYGHGEGDLGVPLLGTGSHASAIGSSYETILSDTVERPSGTSLAFELNSVSFTVSNNIDARERVGTPRMAMSAGNRDVEVATTIIGETESVEQAEQHLGARTQDVVWTLDGGTLQADNAPLTDFSGVAYEAGESALSLDNTFTGQGLTVST